MNTDEKEILLIEEEYAPILTEEECENFNPIMKDFMEGYAHNPEKPVEEWLGDKLKEHLPEKSDDEINGIVQELVSGLKTTEDKKKSMEQATAAGRDKESWFASEAVKAASAMSVQQSTEYLEGLDRALNEANAALHRTITTQTGAISRNPNLDGFIAEQYHAQTFNLNAKAAGSPNRAIVLEPDGHGYTKNSVDIEIVDGNGKVLKRYQSKYCKDANATQRAFEKGDYRGQQKLVPEGQQEGISKKTTTVIGADGITSSELTKSDAERMRDEAQSGNWNDLNWNEYAAKDLAKGIATQAGYAAVQGAVIGAGMDIAQKAWNGERIKGEEVVEESLKTGADFGVKAAVAGALKVGAEKGIIHVLPKGIPSATMSNIAFVAVENAKTTWKIASGDYSFEEGVNEIEKTTLSSIIGLTSMVKGQLAGMLIGLTFGVPGIVVGYYAGGTVGYMAGSKVGQAIAKGNQKLRAKGMEFVKQKKEQIKAGFRNLGSRLRRRGFS